MIVLVLGIEIFMERLMFAVEHVMKSAMRTVRVRLIMERLVHRSEILVALLEFLAKLLVALAMLSRGYVRAPQGQ